MSIIQFTVEYNYEGCELKQLQAKYFNALCIQESYLIKEVGAKT